MAKERIGQLVYTIDADDHGFVQALNRSERLASRSMTTVTSHFSRLEQQTVKAQRAMFGMAAAADFLDARLGGFVFSAVRAIDVLSSIGLASASSARHISSVAKEAESSTTAVQDFQIGMRNFHNEMNAQTLQHPSGALVTKNARGQFEKLKATERGPGGRFQSFEQQQLRAQNEPFVSTETLRGLALGPTLGKSAFAAGKTAEAMTSMGKAAAFAGASVAYVATGFKAMFFNPIGAAILTIGAAFATFSYFSNKAAESEDRRKKAFEESIETDRKKIASLQELSDAARRAAEDEPGASSVSLRQAQGRGGDAISEIEASRFATLHGIKTSIESSQA